MHAAQATQLAIIEALYANGDACGARLARAGEQLVGERLGVCLEGELVHGARGADGRDERGQPLGAQHRGRAAANVGAPRTAKKPDFTRLPHEPLERALVGKHAGVVVVRGRRGEVAVAAAPHAKGNVQVESLDAFAHSVASSSSASAR